MRIQLPRILVKIMRKRKLKNCSRDTDDGNIDKSNKKIGSIFFKSRSETGTRDDGNVDKSNKKIGSIFFKSRSETGTRDNTVDKHGGNDGSDMEGATTMLQTLLKIDDYQSGDYNNIQIDDPSRRQKVAPGIGKPTLSISQSFREMLHNAGKFNGRKDSVGNQVMDKLRISSTILKMRKTSNCNAPVLNTISRDIDGSRNQTRSEFSPWGLNRKSRSRKVPKEEANTMELCKKRIMMGRRCRSLNLSGSLQYDENGILLPEELIPAEDV